MGIVPQDLRYAMRNLRRTPGFTLVAAATLAVGIGANAAIFSVVNAILLNPLPFEQPDKLVRLYESEAAPGKYPFAGPDFVDWKAQNRTFDDMTLFGWPHDMNLSGGSRPDHILAVPTAANYFSLLGATPLFGRTWAAGEDQPGKGDVAVLSYALWNSRFAADPQAVGKTVELNSRKYTVVGVMPPDFRFPPQAQLWIPQDMSPNGLNPRGNHWANAVGRMKKDATLAAAQADLTQIAANLEKTYPASNHKVGAIVVPLHEDLVGKSRDSLLMMLSAVGLVLLIACANVANLLLSRAVARQKEMAVRSAVGAGRWRLVRQLLTESMVLAVCGGALGLALAWAILKLFAGVTGAGLPRFAVAHLDGTVLAFGSLLAALTGLVFGLYPALATSRPTLHEELKGGAGSSVSQGRQRRFTSNLLVICEFAFSVLLLASAGLLLKDFVRVRNAEIGTRTEGIWTAAVQLPEAKYGSPEQRYSFAQSLLADVAALPGVQAAALTDRLPLEGGSNYFIKIRGRVNAAPMSGPLVERHNVTTDYFRALGVKLVKGRLFTEADTQGMGERMARTQALYADPKKPPTPEQTNALVFPTVVNEAMVRAFWPNEDPLGQMFSNGNDNGPWRQIVGVVSDVRQRGLTEKARPEAYDILGPSTGFFIVLRTTLPPESLTAGVRRTLERKDAGLPLFSVRTMQQVVADNAQGKRFLSLLIGSFAALAALLAAIGMYGVLSYAVTQRTREMGIRMALGASRGQLLGAVLADGLRLAVPGFAIGIAGALAVGRIMASLLNEVQPRDPSVLIATAALLAVVALVACYLPARRAAALDPISALRHD